MINAGVTASKPHDYTGRAVAVPHKVGIQCRSGAGRENLIAIHSVLQAAATAGTNKIEGAGPGDKARNIVGYNARIWTIVVVDNDGVVDRGRGSRRDK